MRRIGIDCRLWNETGIGRYIRNIVKELAEIDTRNEYILFVLRKDIFYINKLDLPANFKMVVVDVRWYTFKEQLVLPFILYREKLDIFWAPNLNVPVLYFKRFVVTIHDLTVLKIKTGRSSTHAYSFYLLKRFAVWLPLYFAVTFSKAIFTVSQFVKDDLIETLNANDEKIFLTPNAASSKFKKQSSRDVEQTLAKYNIKTPYLFYVGNAHPHKNIESLIKAFEIIKESQPNLQLVLGGDKKFFYERLEAEWSASVVSKSIKFIGFVDDNDLPALYTGAESFVTPSFFEGFGIQILEAFACGTKVVCSNTTSLPEIGGNIAYYFNPRDVKNIASAIVSCLNDNNKKRIEAGLNRVNDFSWKRSAQIVHRILNTIL